MDDWATMKEKTKYGCVPVAEIDGKEYAQGLALANYFAKLAKLYPEDPLEALKTDEISQLREDLLVPETQVYLEKDEKVQAEKGKKMFDETYPRYLRYFENYLKESSGNFVIGNKLSMADIVIYEGTTTISQLNPDLFKKYPLLVKHRDTIAAEDGIKQYLAQSKQSKSRM